MQETQETRVQSLGREDPLETGMTPRSSILAWKVSWTEESGGLQSMGPQESDMTERLTNNIPSLSTSPWLICSLLWRVAPLKYLVHSKSRQEPRSPALGVWSDGICAFKLPQRERESKHTFLCLLHINTWVLLPPMAPLLAQRPPASGLAWPQFSASCLSAPLAAGHLRAVPLALFHFSLA